MEHFRSIGVSIEDIYHSQIAIHFEPLSGLNLFGGLHGLYHSGNVMLSCHNCRMAEDTPFVGDYGGND